MIKKFFSLMGALALICFSFYYTDSAVDIVKRNDPIMKEIIKVSKEYEQSSTDAVLKENSIVPGISGVKVDIDRSYEKMKKYGSFDAGLLVFEEVVPTISTSNTYDKFIVKGNSAKKSISLLFKVKNSSYIDEILETLKAKKIEATFFITEDILYNDIDILEKLYLNGHSIELLSDTYSSLDMRKVNKTMKALMGSVAKYCYSEEENTELIDTCKKNKMHSIIPSIITSNFPYSDIKNHVTSGSIISLNNDINAVRELSSILNYLNQKGYNIISLEELLKE